MNNYAPQPQRGHLPPHHHQPGRSMRRKITLTMTAVAIALAGLPGLADTASATPTLANPCRVKPWDGTVTANHKVHTLSHNPNLFRTWNSVSPFVGARWSPCAGTVTVYFAHTVTNYDFHNLRINGQQSEVSVKHLIQRRVYQKVLPDSEFGEGMLSITMQSCMRNFLAPSLCDEWSPVVRVGVHMGRISQGQGSKKLPYGPDTCKQGYVWREATPSDLVCVTPATRTQAKYDNSQAATRLNPTGPYGPNTCVQGYVWREAFTGDLVCVTPETRTQAKYDNSQSANRKERA